MSEVVIKLIETGLSNPDQINKYGDTALISACENNLSDVAIKLIESGLSKHNQINNYKNTALILACYNNMSEVALKLIETGLLKLDQINNDGNTALILACNNNMSEVIVKLEHSLLKNQIINDAFLFDSLLEKNNDKNETINKLLEKNKGECIICLNKSNDTYCFIECCHIMNLHKSCVEKINRCPMCRKKSIVKKCYICV
jgi:ankyrin repeat protein